MSLDFDCLTPTGGREYGVRLIKPWILHASLELYRGMVAQLWSVVFSMALFEIFSAYTNSLIAIRYVKLLGDHLYPFMLFCYPHGDVVSSKTTLATSWLDEHSSVFSVRNWLLGNPYLNPIDHPSDVLEQGVRGHLTATTKLTEL
ncbi:transposable element Tcb2 transposase [Trichonephila clavipes]|nr:transposable element Tcb2 transposase [Trichonephila clavipes]